MTTALLAAAVALNALALWSLAKERGRSARLELSVRRLLDDVYGKPKPARPVLPPPPTRAFPLVRPASWSDSRLVTQVRGSELPGIDFAHRRW
jgi:hypothetical protein